MSRNEFDFTAHDLFQHIMVDTRIEFLNVDFQAISGVLHVFQRFIYFQHTPVYTPIFDARKRVRREHRNPYWFENVHYSVMNDSVGEIRQPIYLPLFGVFDDKCFVL